MSSIEQDYYKSKEQNFDRNDPNFNGWGSLYSQFLRYQVIVEVLENEVVKRGSTGNSILEVGCGSNSQLKRMLKEMISTNQFSEKIVGIDKRESLGGVDYLEKDYFQEFDYIVASGTYAFLDDLMLIKYIDKSIREARKGIVFNLLDDSHNQNRPEPVKYKNKREWFSRLFNKYAVQEGYRVMMRDDYMPSEDFTIAIFK